MIHWAPVNNLHTFLKAWFKYLATVRLVNYHDEVL